MKYMKMLNHNKPAFTMLELVFVIVVIGIIASLAIPRLDRDLRQGAKDNILAAISLTQHIALVDNKTIPTDTNWQKRLWTIHFTRSATDNEATFYTISSDDNNNSAVSKDETVIDPANGKYMYNDSGDTTVDNDESSNIFIGKNYGIDDITFSGGCSNTSPQHIAFDHLGRPHNGIGSATNTYSTYMASDCNISITFLDTSITPLNIIVATETGYASGD